MKQMVEVTHMEWRQRITGHCSADNCQSLVGAAVTRLDPQSVRVPEHA